MIHTFGDSHSRFGWNKRLVKIHWLGPILCYSFGRDKLERCDINKFGVKDGDIVIFCFGEIDCRCHIHKHISETKGYKEIIDEIVEHYIEAIKVNIEGFKFKHVCIYNVVPPVEKAFVKNNRRFPFLGTDEERKAYALYFNDCLKLECLKNNFIFFDIYSNYADENGYLRKDLNSGVHVGNGCYIDQFIKDKL